MDPKQRMEHTIKTQKRMSVYAKFLENAIEKGWWILPVGIMAECDKTDKVLGIMHTFEGDIDMCKEVGILEKAFNVHCGFACPPAHPDLYTFIRDLGHEPIASFSIFNRDVSLINQFEKSPSSILIEHLKFYRGLGSQPDGLLLPPNPILAEAKMMESDYFSNYAPQKRVTLNMQDGEQVHFLMGIHPLQEFGLTYVCDKIDSPKFVVHGPKDLQNLNEFIETGSGKALCHINPQNWEVS